MSGGANGERGSANGGEPSRNVKSYEDLDAWQLAVALAEAVYRETKGFPREETFGLQSQMRRAAVSVPSNIAEGWGRRTRKDYVRFLRIARGSLFELRTQVEIARRVGFLAKGTAQRLRNDADRVGRVLHGLASALS